MVAREKRKVPRQGNRGVQGREGRKRGRMREKERERVREKESGRKREKEREWKKESE